MIDCTIIGGGAAGLSAALVLGRAQRSTLVLDAGGQSNLPSHGVGGLLGWDGRPPVELYAQGRREVGQYPAVTVEDRRATTIEPDGETFVVDGVPTRRIVLATGMDYELPAIDGIEALWGDTVVHCPFCHGWELRGRALGLIQPDDHHATMLLGILGNWSDDVVRITEPVARLEADDGKLARVVFEDGRVLERGGLLVGPRYLQRGPFVEALGVETKDGWIVADGFGATNVPGVYAAGDAANMPQIQTAIATGAKAGAGVVISLA